MKNLKKIFQAFAGLVIVLFSCKKDDIKSGPWPPAPTLYSGKIAHDWINLETDRIKAAGLFPAVAVRLISYSGLAMYESIVPEYKDVYHYQSLYTYFSGNDISGYPGKAFYSPASVNAAMAEILRKLTTNPAFLKAIDSMETAQRAFFPATMNQFTIDSSAQFGKKVAAAIFEWSKQDGTLNTWPAYVVPAGAGLWEPVPPAFIAPAGTYQGELRPFMKDIVNITSPPPPVYSADTASDFYKMNVNIVNACKDLSQNDTLMVNTWKDIVGINYNIPTHMTRLLAALLEPKGKTLDQVSIIYARNGIALNDAIINCFKSKYKYNMLRPVTYIRETMGLSNWNSMYPSPSHPAYPAIGPTGAAAAASLMETVFGAGTSFTDKTQEALYGARPYASFNAMLNEIGKSRTVGGINYQGAVDAGIAQGRKVGEMALRLPFVR